MATGLVKMDVLYCENDECAVEIYRSVQTTDEPPLVIENCPGCGQFGRKKGKQDGK